MEDAGPPDDQISRPVVMLADLSGLFPGPIVVWFAEAAWSHTILGQ